MHQFYTPDITSTTYTLSEEESKHCIRVLRLKLGDTIQLLDGKGTVFLAEIIDENAKKCAVKIIDKKQSSSKNWNLHIAIAPTKSMDKLEWFVEKATETGIYKIIPINCTNSERSILKNQRLQKVAVAAIKQSLNPFLPEIKDLVDFKKCIEQHKNFNGQKFIAHCNNNLPLPFSFGKGVLPFSGRTDEVNETKPHIKNLYTKQHEVLILIGPEGDFTSEEVKFALDNGFEQISLGKNRLRTETAALYACTIINSINED